MASRYARIALGGLVASSLITLSACSSPAATGDDESAGGDPEVVSLAHGGKDLYSVANLVTVMPEMLGLFEDEGVEVELIQGDAAQNAVQLLAGDRVDLMVANAEAPAAARADQDLPITAVYPLARQSPYHVAVLEDSSIQTVEELDGERVGIIALGSGGATYAENRLTDAGLEVSDVELVPLGVGAPAFEALQGEEVSAFVSFDGDLANGITSGYPIRFLDDPEWQTSLYGFNMYALDSYIDAEQETIEKVGRALARSTEIIVDDPEGAIRMFWEEYPQSAPSDPDDPAEMEKAEAILNAQLTAFHALDAANDVSWGSQEAEVWEFTAEYLYDSGYIENQVDPADLYTNELADAYADFDQNETLADFTDMNE